MSSNDYLNVLKQAREAVSTQLEASERAIRRIVDEAPSGLQSRLETVLSRPGKRVRSTLLFHLVAQADSEVIDRAVLAAASIELLHLASLLHDDVIDETDTRRGMKTGHALWGNSMAVLVGDYTLAKALELVVVDKDSRIPQLISQAASNLVAGEVLELDLAGQNISLQQYYEVIDGKTAALIEAAAGCGAILAGYDETTIQGCKDVGRHFGIGFQIVDDLLDFGFGAADLGKAKFSDLANDVMTLPMILYYENAQEEQKVQMSAWREQAADADVQKKIVQELHAAGVFEQTRDIAMDHVNKALAILEGLPEGESRDHLLNMCRVMVIRSN